MRYIKIIKDGHSPADIRRFKAAIWTVVLLLLALTVCIAAGIVAVWRFV